MLTRETPVLLCTLLPWRADERRAPSSMLIYIQVGSRVGASDRIEPPYYQDFTVQRTAPSIGLRTPCRLEPAAVDAAVLYLLLRATPC
jgi:hypothetical protein